jgi:Sulfotransferase domain
MSLARPNFVIAGAARAGTTALSEIVRRHPLAFMTEPKEPHYFAFAGQLVEFTGPGDAQTINRVAITDERDYLALYPQQPGYVAMGDGSVSTLYHYAHAIPHIRRLNPEMRVLLILREPVDRAYSSYQYLRVRGFEPHVDFRAAVEDEPVRKAAGWHHLWHYVSMGQYADQVAAFLDAFGPEQVRVLFYDDLVARPHWVAEQVYEFLGLPPAPAADIPRVNVSGRPKYVRVQRAIVWAGQREVLRANLKRVVPFAARERIRGAVLTRDELDPATRLGMRDLFAADRDALASLLELPLPGW